MTTVLVLNGPNLQSLGRRETDLYGEATLAEIEELIRRRAQDLGVSVCFEQSNHEGTLVDLLEAGRDSADACIINPGGLSHTSVVLADALRAFGKPVVEVHLSNILRREHYRRLSLTAAAAAGVIAGLGAEGYVLALEAVVQMLREATNDQRG